MNREYHKGYSRELGRDMEMLVYGHSGNPVLVFPTSMAPFFEWEDRRMIEPIGHKVESGEIQFFLTASVDKESWYNRGAHPGYKAWRHVQYDRYLTNELLPYIRSRNQAPSLTVTGCSFGAYHAVNFALKHPDVVSHLVSMSGAFDIQQFLDGHFDDNCYFNCPTAFLPNLSDDWFLSRYRQMKIVLAAGEWDICLDQTVRMSKMLDAKGVPNWLDIWGDQMVHDWPTWQRMVGKYFG